MANLTNGAGDTEEAARAAIELACPDSLDRRAVLARLVDSIEIANSIGELTWAVTRSATGFRLNVGPTEAMTLSVGSTVRLLICGTLPRDFRSREQVEPAPYANAPLGAEIWIGTAREYREIAAAIADPHAAYLRSVGLTKAGKPRSTSFRRSHSEALCRYARSAVRSGEDPPSTIDVLPRTLPGARVLAVVLHLHKMGYQRIRIMPYLSPSGMHWRCAITPRDNMDADGYTLRMGKQADGLVVTYSSAAEALLFNWPDAPTMSVPELAARFLERFPCIASAGHGRDREYTGWLVEVVGEAEKAAEPHLVFLFADFDLSPEYLRRWLPPP